ncbi:hypothetical protein D3C85_1532510 [compost metagenome]
MQRSQYKVACLRRSDCRRDGLQIPHFADKNNIRVLAECSPKSIREAGSITPYFPLMNQRGSMCVQVFHRIFQGDNMLLLGPVNIADHRG